MRLWGKIHGQKADYYIVESTYDKGEEEGEKPADFEAHGTGINKSYYWAANSPLGNWTCLPDITPSDLNAARGVKVNFSGDLDRVITTNPFFFKKESFYLRAQIARIHHSTLLVPKRVYRFVEESTTEIEENVPDEGPIPIPSTDMMADPSFWCHFSNSILKCGRTVLMEPEPAEGDERDPEEIKKELEKLDPSEARLKPITDDDTIRGGLPSW